MKPITRAVVALGLLVPTGFLTACAGTNEKVDSGIIVDKQSSADNPSLPPQCRLRLDGDRSGWVAVIDASLDPTDHPKQSTGAEVCAKAAVRNMYQLSDSANLSITVHGTRTVQKFDAGQIRCTIGVSYDGGKQSVSSSPRAKDCDGVQSGKFDETVVARIRWTK